MKRTRSVMLAAILLLSAMVVFAGTAAADDEEVDPIRFDGYITDANGDGIEGADVTIEKWTRFYCCPPHFGDWHRRDMGSDTTNATGYYMTPYKKIAVRPGHYRMLLDGNVVEEKDLLRDDFDWDRRFHWTHHDWNYQIPEFATIAIPAVALLGLFAFYRRKQKK